MLTVQGIIAQVESAGRSAALRLEPTKLATYQARLAAPAPTIPPEVRAAAHYNVCSLQTAAMVCATSWGRFQIMGFNLYGLVINGGFGYGETIADFLADQNSDQIDAFNWFLRVRGISDISADDLTNDANARIRFATSYNGPGAPQQYADAIKQAIAALSA